ncbi:MAG: hypothetical protein HYV35_09350 [Lentisphaerae bacterium]|nr:hypothetical protein [Lentisphaerota bacterium]
MKPSRYLRVTAVIAFICAVTSLAQETVTTKDGRSAIINSDGTWHYSTNSPVAIPVSALDAVRAYLAASSWRDRIPLVLNPEKVKPLMEARYGERAWNAPRFDILTGTEPAPTQTGWVKIQADVEGRTLDYYLKKTKDGYRIDWETSVGSNPVSPEEFRATRPTTPVRFRVLAKLDDYYNYEFRDAQDFAWSIALTDGGEKNIGHGYAKKNTAMGQYLFKKLKDGKKHPIVVEVQCLPNASDGSVFLITGVVNLDGWWFGETEKVAQPTLSPGRSPVTGGRR